MTAPDAPGAAPGARETSGPPRPTDAVSASWRVRLVLWALAPAAGGGVTSAALWAGAPEVALLGAVLTAGSVFGLLRHAAAPPRALTALLRGAAARGGLRPEGLDLPARSAGVGEPLRQALHDAFEASERRVSVQAARLLALEALVRHAGVALVAFEAGGRIVDANLAARRLLGAPRLQTLADIPDDLAGLREVLDSLKPGATALVEGVRAGRPFGLSVAGASYVARGRKTMIVALTDIRPELDDRESEAWTAMSRVLLHEIANSATPIASLSETAARRLSSGAVTARDVSAAAEAVETVARRARGLVRFVEGYRAVSRVPPPDRRPVAIAALLADVERLFSRARGAVTVSTTPPGLVAYVDPDLAEQAVINLVRNGLQAAEAEPAPLVRIAAAPDGRGRVVIRVMDNGPGIEPEALSSIFVPFYTTREGGSGIGLPLARQIARLHGGRLDVASAPGQTVFTLSL